MPSASDHTCTTSMICSVNSREPSGSANLLVRACRSRALALPVCDVRFCGCYSMDGGLHVHCVLDLELASRWSICKAAFSARKRECRGHKFGTSMVAICRLETEATSSL